MQMEPRKTKNVVWHSTYCTVYTVCIRACARFLSDQSKHGDGKSCRARGAIHAAIHQNVLRKNICTLFSPSHVSLNSTGKRLLYSQTLCPQSSIFPGQRHVLTACLHVFRVVSIYDGLSMWHMAPHHLADITENGDSGYCNCQ
jgi:hypothetical protein